MSAVRRIAAGTTAVLVGGLLGAVTAPQPAHADEVYPRPADGIFLIDGHGWGHGRGLNQWGAQGAATQGVTATTILNTYYPGTASATLPARNIRVLLQEDEGRDVVVRAVSGLAVRDLARGLRYVLPAGYTSWRIFLDSAGFRVQGYNNGWRPWGSGGVTAWSGPMQFEGVSPLRLGLAGGSQRDYRGVLRAWRTGATSLATVNELSLEHYLYGVVPRESPASFHPQALRAQAVAARSYSAYKRDHVPAGSGWDICSTVQCQVYGGVRIVTSTGTTIELEHAATNEAVDATRGVMRAYGGKAIFAEYSSSNGGWSTASTTFPYLAAKADPWDAIASPHHSWKAEVSTAQIEARYPSVGRLQRIKVIGRDGNGDWGGRVKTVVLEGVSASGSFTSVQATGAGIYNANSWPTSAKGLRGSWWKIRPTVAAIDFSGTLIRVAAQVVRPAYWASALFDVRNTGNLDWPVGGDVRSGLRGGDSPSYNAATWLTPQRPGPLTVNLSRQGATVVKPGEVARFAFRLAGNNRAEGVYDETFGVVWEGRYWLALDAPLSYRLQLLFAGALVAAPPTLVLPGHGTKATSFDVRNTGDMAWPLSAPIHTTASSSASADTSWLNATRPSRIGANVTRPGATEVAVGEVARFPLTLAGNGRRPTSTESTETFGIVWERRAHATVRAPVRYTIRNVFTGSVVAAPPRLRVPVNGVGLVTVDIRNTGNLTWPVRGLVRIATWPPGRLSPSRSSSWVASTRPGYLVANLTMPGAAGVRPGETARFAFGLAGNGRPVGTVVTETFGVAFEGVGYLPATFSVTYELREALAGSLVYISSPLYLPRTEITTAYVDIRNEGTVAWPVRGAVRLTSPYGSPSQTPSWIAPIRPAAIASNRTRPAATTVGPGEVARFVVPLSGNGRPAETVATETFGVAYDGRGYLALRIPVRYTVRGVFAGRLAGVASAVSVPRVGAARVWFDVVNVGNIAWPVGGAVNSAITSSAARAPSWLNAVRPGHLSENRTRPGATSVRPGERARFAFDLAGNGRAAGSYSETLRVVWERRFWMALSVTLRYSIV